MAAEACCMSRSNVEVEQGWLPLSPEGVRNYQFYTDTQADRTGYFLFEGGALYRIVKFEVKKAPEYSRYVLEKPRDDRYPEVFLTVGSAARCPPPSCPTS
jgi:hypothetical protein